MHFLSVRYNVLTVSDTRTAETLVIGVKYLGINTVLRNAYVVILSEHRLEVADTDYSVAALVNTLESKNALGVVVVVNPLEALPREVNLIKRRILQIEEVDCLEEIVQLLVLREVKQIPLKLACRIPLVKLTDFRAHKGELFTWVNHHISDKGTNARELHIIVARHFIYKRAFTVNNLIVRNRKQEVFGECIEKAEGKRIVMERAVKRVERHIAKHIVHPAHIPLVVKAKSAVLCRS